MDLLAVALNVFTYEGSFSYLKYIKVLPQSDQKLNMKINKSIK